MKKLFLSILICSLSLISQGQSINGTLIITCIGKDGIMLATDTRVGISDKNGKQLAYLDGISKICKLGKYAVAIMGLSHSDNVNLTLLFGEFNKDVFLDNTAIKDIPKTWYDFMATHIDESSFNAFAGNTYIIVGYENKTPCILPFRLDTSIHQIITERISNFYVTDSLANTLFKNGKKRNLNEMSELAVKSIYQSAKATHTESKIGGPISILIIKPNGVFIPNKYCNFKNYSNKDIATAYKKRSNNFTILNPKYKIKLDSLYNNQ